MNVRNWNCSKAILFISLGLSASVVAAGDGAAQLAEDQKSWSSCAAGETCTVTKGPCGSPVAVNSKSEKQYQAWMGKVAPSVRCAAQPGAAPAGLESPPVSAECRAAGCVLMADATPGSSEAAVGGNKSLSTTPAQQDPKWFECATKDDCVLVDGNCKRQAAVNTKFVDQYKHWVKEVRDEMACGAAALIAKETGAAAQKHEADCRIDKCVIQPAGESESTGTGTTHQ